MPERSRGVRAYLIGVTRVLSTNELLATVGRRKMLDWQDERAGSRARVRLGVAVWVAGKRRGRLNGSARREGGIEEESAYSTYMRVLGSAVPWRKTWDTATPPFSATLTARHHSYVQLKRGVLCCDID